VATLTIWSAITPSGGKLGKLVGSTALGFELRDVPHHIKQKLQGQVRRWHNAPDKDDIKRWQSEAWAVERCLGYGRRTRGCGC
jgi:hypothetical protein